MTKRVLCVGLLVVALMGCGGGSSDGGSDTTVAPGATTTAAPAADSPNKAACKYSLFAIGTAVRDGNTWRTNATKFEGEGTDAGIVAAMRLLAGSLDKSDKAAQLAAATQLNELCKSAK